MTKQVEHLIIVLAIALLALTPKVALAQYQPDEEVNQIIVDKQIKGLNQGEWKDNYPSSFMIFGPNTEFEFKITVKNTGNRNLTWIKVTDSMPKVLNYIFGRQGANFDATKSLITWSIPEIKPGEEQVTTIRVKTKDAVYIPKAITEKVNKVCVKAESGATDCDDSHFYVGSGTATSEAVQLPVTGTNPLALSLLGITLASATFFSLKKFA